MIVKLLELYGAGEVKRLHTVPTHRSQSIAEHVYGSMLVAMALIEEGSLTARIGPVLETLLYHDVPELETGDVPAPVKVNNPALRVYLDEMEAQFYLNWNITLPMLSSTEDAVVHAADTLDLAFTCYRERSLGNRTAKLDEVFMNCTRYLAKCPLNCVHELLAQLKEKYDGLT